MHLLKHCQPALKRFEQGEPLPPTASGGTIPAHPDRSVPEISNKHASAFHKCLQCEQGSHFDPHRPQRQRIERFVEFRLREQLFVSRRLDASFDRAATCEPPHGGTPISAPWLPPWSATVPGNDSLSGIAGDPPPEPTSMKLPAVEGTLTGRDDRLQEQPIDGLVRIVERRQVDLAVPAESSS